MSELESRDSFQSSYYPKNHFLGRCVIGPEMMESLVWDGVRNLWWGRKKGEWAWGIRHG